MNRDGKIKRLAHRLISATWFHPVHMGQYIRALHFRPGAGVFPCDGSAASLPPAADRVLTPWKWPVYSHGPRSEHRTFTRPPFNRELQPTSTCPRATCSCCRPARNSTLDILEHIRGNPTVMSNFHRALSPGGYLFLHVPDDRDQKRIFPKHFFKDFDHQLLSKMGFPIVLARRTFGLPGQLAWELDHSTDKHWRTKIILMPRLKMLARISVHLRPPRGSLLVVAQK